ncbi:type V CRISPR-associated endonuclease Cas1 [Leptospira sp. 96542]|nr:type V CRISPR-associated endonuclease Cas1 [Leptospira sp. 96542]
MLSLPDFREKHIVVSFPSEGQAISFKNDNLIIKDGDNNTILQTSCYRIFSVIIVGGTTLTTGIIERSKKFGFSIYLMSYGLKPIGVWNSSAEGNFLLRQKQYSYSETKIALSLVKNKIHNQISLLKSVRSKSNRVKDAILSLESYKSKSETDLKSILGMEGIASRVFFQAWFEELNWKGRKPRSKIDITNTLMDIGYTYLFYFLESMLNLYGFDIFKGVYHQNFYQRKSLVCDLVEPFRCIIDRRIKTAYGLNQIQEKDFTHTKGQWFLKIDQNKKYSQWIVSEILKYKEPIFQYVQEYYRAFMRNKPIEEYPVFEIIPKE